jgi:hypothetical protein
MSPIYVPGKVVLAQTYVGIDDPDAAAYITNVEAADTAAGQSGGLETATKVAIHSFVKGCKADGIWPAIKASCILAGARTLPGALVPLVGTAPTRQGTEGGWNYDRKIGLTGNGTDNYLNSGFLATGISATSNHLFVNGSSFPTTGSTFRTGIGSWASSISRLNITLLDSLNERRYQDAVTYASINSGLATSGSVSGARLSTTLNTLYQNGSSVNTLTLSISPTMPAFNFFVYALNLAGSPVDLTNACFNFYGIGDGLTGTQMTAYHARVTTLINTFGAAIP